MASETDDRAQAAQALVSELLRQGFAVTQHPDHLRLSSAGVEAFDPTQVLVAPASQLTADQRHRLHELAAEVVEVLDGCQQFDEGLETCGNEMRRREVSRN